MTGFRYQSITGGIAIRANPRWLPDESSPARGRYVWAYDIEIENVGSRVWTLTHRHWRIVDVNGQSQTVDGEGVVGQTPRLEPGESFTYTSGAPLTAPSGVMGGYFLLVSETGEELKAEVPTFSLDSPYEKSRPS